MPGFESILDEDGDAMMYGSDFGKAIDIFMYTVLAIVVIAILGVGGCSYLLYKNHQINKQLEDKTQHSTVEPTKKAPGYEWVTRQVKIPYEKLDIDYSKGPF